MVDRINLFREQQVALGQHWRQQDGDERTVSLYLCSGTVGARSLACGWRHASASFTQILVPGVLLFPDHPPCPLLGVEYQHPDCLGDV